ncbi:terminase large subunit domain-containing protein [uncultured Methanobrevibacter sp.]|uniref:terminase large subunit domain-containing protein n=1 Tax=uncultured Methanobrevibacter sp. TaxID=253161 RepID=UPI0025CE64F9|nr:terminase family protein [uncultured Methanobrevibacter sp.]
MKINFNINLTRKQKEAYDIMHDKETQFLIARWSRQCGKTVFAEIMMIEYLCKSNSFNAYISPTFAQGKKVFAELVALLETTGIIKKANAQDLKIESIYGATLKFFSMESPISIRGNTVSGLLVMDEAAFFPSQLPDGSDPYYNVIFPIIKARKPKVLVISTPNGRQGMYYDLYLKAYNKTSGYRELTASIYDDDLIKKEEIEELKKGYPPLAFQQEFEVQFLDNALTVFPNFQNCFDGKFEKGKCWIGVDPSSVGEDNTIVSIINADKQVKQYKIDGTLDMKYAKIAKIINEYKPVATYIENNSIGEVMANEIKKQLINKSNFYTFTTTNETKKQYISLLAVAIANNEIHFEQDNTLLYSELATFTFKLTKTGNITYAAKEGYHDDTVTSLGICMQCKEDFKLSGTPNVDFMITSGYRMVI